MSTVDAAIINHITNGGSSGGGGYTAGAGIALRNKAISVDFDPATMEINAHGQLASKITGGSSEGGGSSIIYTGGPGISVDAYNKISAVYNPNTIEIIDGAISAKVSESGGVSTDVGVIVEDAITNYSSNNIVNIHGIHNINDTYTGMLFYLRNANTNNLDSFVLVRTNYTTLTEGREEGTSVSSMSYNAVFYPLFDNGPTYNVKIYSDDGLTYTIRIEDIIPSNYKMQDSENKFMRPVQLTTRTLSTISFVNNNLLRNWQSLLNYFETTVEALKKKVGI